MAATDPSPGGCGCQGTGEPFVRAGTPAGNWVLLAVVLGSGMAFIDGSIVNVALPRIGDDLDADVSELQWIVNAYLLSLASLILVGGGLGDRFGRRRVFHIGIGWFGAASLLCAIAQTPDQLVLARLVQGIGGALLTPGSLAIIQASFRPADRGKVIGQWAGLGGVAAAIGPPVGGWVIETASWRWIFLANVPLAIAIVVVGLRHVPESLDPDAKRGYDVLGSALVVIGLGGVTFALIEASSSWALPFGVAGAAALAGFLLVESRSAHPLMPLHLFGSRVFSVANAMTLVVYGSLGAMTFFLVLQLQVVVGYAPWQAGMATLPMTVVMALLSSRSGALAARIGPRLQMSFGPLLCAGGVLWLALGRCREQLSAARAARADAVLLRHGLARRAADDECAGGRARPVRRRGERDQQRGGAHRVAARRRGPARAGRAGRQPTTPSLRCSTRATRRRCWSAACCW